MVGAVVVRDGETVGEGWHAEFGGPHAEVVALERAGERARGSTVYVTLEPCAHAGKTPPCTDALVRAGVARVVCAVRDPNPVAAGGAERLEAAGVEVEFGLEEEEAIELNAPFFHALSSPRPFVTLKLATSIDGAIADASGTSRWLTGEKARRYVHRLRAGHDAVAVGVGHRHRRRSIPHRAKRTSSARSASPHRLRPARAPPRRFVARSHRA